MNTKKTHANARGDAPMRKGISMRNELTEAPFVRAGALCLKGRRALFRITMRLSVSDPSRWITAIHRLGEQRRRLDHT